MRAQAAQVGGLSSKPEPSGRRWVSGLAHISLGISLTQRTDNAKRHFLEVKTTWPARTLGWPGVEASSVWGGRRLPMKQSGDGEQRAASPG